MLQIDSSSSPTSDNPAVTVLRSCGADPTDAETWVFFYVAGQEAKWECVYSIPQTQGPLSCQTNMTMSHETLYRLVIGAEGDGKERGIFWLT